MNFTEQILHWYSENKRDLPWRQTRSPYNIWLSEIILQQTRVNQGLKYYNKFIELFPRVKDLAEAEEDFVLKAWQGLGYYNRALNLHHTAKHVSNNFNGEFPKSYQELLKLKGIGKYTAAAIASIAFNETVPAIDGNVLRVISRIFEVSDPIDKKDGYNKIAQISQEVISKERPGDYNQALMDFGSSVCLPKSPKCEICPFVLDCRANKMHLIEKLPVKSQKIKQTERFFNYLIILHTDITYISKRGAKDIWRNLYEFPLIETKSLIEESDLFSDANFIRLIDNQEFELNLVSQTYKHILSHQILFVRFFVLKIEHEIELNFKEITIQDLHKFAFPKVIERFLESDEFRQI